jgi:phosphohistidine phosphatase
MAVKTLTLIRHAKSSWDVPGLDDVDRPLSRRGRRDAPLMGLVLAGRGFAPEIIMASPALRALRTAEALAAAIAYPVPRIVLDPRLYQADSEGLLQVVRSMDSGLEWVAWVGHNPGLTELAHRLARRRLDNVPTCGVVEMRFASEGWTDIGRSRPKTFDFDFPKQHPSS